jgi:acyl-CoA reductase-like NAD-dependent aldehyde dehydrogenase
VAAESERLARQIATEVGKPVRDARAEVAFAVQLMRAAVGRSRDKHEDERGPEWRVCRRPHGVVALITPWNNPLAIPLGTLAPALLYGNAAVLKPSPPGAGVALTVLALLERAGAPADVVHVVNGDAATAQCVIEDPRVGAVSLTGSTGAGAAGRASCARRGIPFQGELGGNNAAIVWSDADLPSTAEQVAAGAFGSAGQRCTANRRVIVDESCYDTFLAQLERATAALAWGDPLEEHTQVGPLVNDAALRRVTAVVTRARSAGWPVLQAHAGSPAGAELLQAGCYFPPTIVLCDDPAAGIVQEETFGPVLVVQRARDVDHALALNDGVPQGLVASLFTHSAALQERFLAETRAGILKLNRATAGVDAAAPFGGWKASGDGPPEHGSGDALFYTRPQTVYGVVTGDG